MAGRQPYDSEGPLARNSSPHAYAHGLHLSVCMSLCGFLILFFLWLVTLPVLICFCSSVSRLWVDSFLYCCGLKCVGPLELGPVRLSVGLGPAPEGENQGRRESWQGTGGGASTEGGEGHTNTSTKICMYV